MNVGLTTMISIAKGVMRKLELPPDTIFGTEFKERAEFIYDEAKNDGYGTPEECWTAAVTLAAVEIMAIKPGWTRQDAKARLAMLTAELYGFQDNMNTAINGLGFDAEKDTPALAPRIVVAYVRLRSVGFPSGAAAQAAVLAACGEMRTERELAKERKERVDLN